MSANALTYEEAFDTIKTIPNMKGVDGTEDRDDFHKKALTHYESTVKPTMQ